MICISLIRLTASSLGSIVYARFGIFISCLAKVTQFQVTLGRRDFWGSSVRGALWLSALLVKHINAAGRAQQAR